MNNYLFFCENNVRKYFKSLQKKNMKHDHKQFANKNRNTLLNEYNKKNPPPAGCSSNINTLNYLLYASIIGIIGIFIMKKYVWKQ